ncbi:MAG: hypothetical protein QNJ12_03800 [Ilumatobacter sp.]|uniref:hypothetical protein n=1 Tax=Ilumatobacter sp. TaxID=1967498 RepID=UPI002621EA87|nr:hypothetical protein [Ilumatobacter sp.]MDJ0767886.1 hypothetical protein [Ilumatobacter sp.]
MFFWFLGTVVLAVWFVFRDPSFDYRLLAVGAVLPALVDAPFGGARVLHSVTFSVALLAVLMLATPGRKPIRKMLLGLPVGTLLHLVFTGAWTDTTVFWWPFGGFGFDGAAHPVASRGWWNVPLEIIGIGLCVWIVRHAGLRDADRRAWFRRTGQLALPTR